MMQTTSRATAERFAQFMVTGNFQQATEMLEDKKDNSPSALESNYLQMVSYGDGVANHIEVIETLTDWPGKRETDAQWVYVAICGEGFSEAVAVIVTKRNLIHTIEWGRP